MTEIVIDNDMPKDKDKWVASSPEEVAQIIASEKLSGQVQIVPWNNGGPVQIVDAGDPNTVRNAADKALESGSVRRVHVLPVPKTASQALYLSGETPPEGAIK